MIERAKPAETVVHRSLHPLAKGSSAPNPEGLLAGVLCRVVTAHIGPYCDKLAAPAERAEVGAEEFDARVVPEGLV